MKGRGAEISGGFRELDELVLHLKGLVLVHKLRRQRGADADELLMYRTAIEGTRDRLASLVMTGNAEPALAYEGAVRS
ncbi:MAG TPA: hypothetical protein VF025_03010 [Gaiellaceae bacterium]